MINHLKFGKIFLVWLLYVMKAYVKALRNRTVQGIDDRCKWDACHIILKKFAGQHHSREDMTWHLASSSVRGLLAAVESLETSSRVFNEHTTAWWHGASNSDTMWHAAASGTFHSHHF